MTVSPVRAAVYLRISLDREMDGLAVDRQEKTCLQIAADRSREVARTYFDQSKSATDKTKRRPGYERMVADYETGAFSVIICWDLDRLTRQPRQLEDWIDVAETRNLRIVTANGEFDLATDGGPSMTAALSGRSGEWAPTTLPHLPKRSRVLALERNRRRLAAQLEPAVVPEDEPWVSSTVFAILRNPRYAGFFVGPGGVGTRRGGPVRTGLSAARTGTRSGGYGRRP